MNQENHNYGVVLVTVSSLSEGEKIATILIQEKLAACINLMPITSFYTWEGKLCQDQEYQLIMKTDLTKFAQLESKIKQLHSYDVPEIIAIPIVKGSESYLTWIKDSLTTFHHH